MALTSGFVACGFGMVCVLLAAYPLVRLSLRLHWQHGVWGGSYANVEVRACAQ